MTNDERMQRESSLIAIIRTKLPDFAKASLAEVMKEMAKPRVVMSARGWRLGSSDRML